MACASGSACLASSAEGGGRTGGPGPPGARSGPVRSGVYRRFGTHPAGGGGGRPGPAQRQDPDVLSRYAHSPEDAAWTPGAGAGRAPHLRPCPPPGQPGAGVPTRQEGRADGSQPTVLSCKLTQYPFGVSRRPAIRCRTGAQAGTRASCYRGSVTLRDWRQAPRAGVNGCGSSSRRMGRRSSWLSHSRARCSSGLTAADPDVQRGNSRINIQTCRTASMANLIIGCTANRDMRADRRSACLRN